VGSSAAAASRLPRSTERCAVDELDRADQLHREAGAEAARVATASDISSLAEGKRGSQESPRRIFALEERAERTTASTAKRIALGG
jgi:hypothetical protein